MWVHELPFVSADGAVLRRLFVLRILRATLCADVTLHGSLHSLFSMIDSTFASGLFRLGELLKLACLRRLMKFRLKDLRV
jgi:hypothetical protein